MTDAELAEYLHLTPAEAATVLPKLTPERRELYDRMKQVEVDAALWVNGLGPKPEGVLIDTERDSQRRRGWRRAGYVGNSDPITSPSASMETKGCKS